MEQSKGHTKEAVLVWISEDDELVPETRELCSSAGYRIVAEVRQSRDRPHARFYLGSGKISELGELKDIQIIITPADLSPSQIFSMGKMTDMIVVDRIRLILELFRKRATSPNARLQVEMADLQYQLPILKEYIHKGTLSDRPGFLAGGEYRVDYYYEMARKRMAHIRDQLRLERKRRTMKRSLRKKRGSHMISVAGYTNAGKSTLSNVIADAKMPEKSMETADRMFTTIATSTRKMRGDRNCIITDTVGFIRDLPPWLIEGFMSTLEEVFESDIVLLLVDASEDVLKVSKKTKDSLDILKKGNCSGRIILVLNKIDDLIEEDEMFLPERNLPFEDYQIIDGTVKISARNEEGIDELLELIDIMLPDMINISIYLPLTPGSRGILSYIRKNSKDLKIEYSGTSAIINCKMEMRWAGTLQKSVADEGGSLKIDEEEMEYNK